VTLSFLRFYILRYGDGHRGVYQTGEEVVVGCKADEESLVEEICMRMKDSPASQETIPTLIGQSLITEFINRLNLDMLAVTNEPNLPELLKEDEHTRIKRDLLKSHKAVLDKATNRIRRVFQYLF
jgi:hypothetical protein